MMDDWSSILDLGAAKPAPEEDWSSILDLGDPFEGEGEGVGSLLARRGRQVGQAATDIVAGIPQSYAAAETAATEPNFDYYAEAAERINARKEQIAALTAELPNLPGDDERRMVQDAIAEMEALNKQDVLRLSVRGRPATPLSESSSFAVGDAIRAGGEALFGAPDPRDRSFGADVAGGAGSVAAGAGIPIATTAIGAGLGAVAGSVIPGAGTVAGAAAGAQAGRAVGTGLATAAFAGSMGRQGYEAALAAGADEETARQVFLLHGAVGTSNIVPIFNAVKALPIPGEVKKRLSGDLAQRFARILRSAGEEAAQEAIEQVATNIIDQQLYDPERSWTEGAGYNALLGGIIGGGLRGGVEGVDAAVRRSGERRVNEQPKEEEAPSPVAGLDADPLEAPLNAPQPAAPPTQTPASPLAATPAAPAATAPVAPPAQPSAAIPDEAPAQSGPYAAPDESALLLAMGEDPADIMAMNPAERAAAAQEAASLGVAPLSPNETAAAMRPILAELDAERPDSPFVTPEDRASPIPTDVIDDGKREMDAMIAAADPRNRARFPNVPATPLHSVAPQPVVQAAPQPVAAPAAPVAPQTGTRNAQAPGAPVTASAQSGGDVAKDIADANALLDGYRFVVRDGEIWLYRTEDGGEFLAARASDPPEKRRAGMQTGLDIAGAEIEIVRLWNDERFVPDALAPDDDGQGRYYGEYNLWDEAEFDLHRIGATRAEIDAGRDAAFNGDRGRLLAVIEAVERRTGLKADLPTLRPPPPRPAEVASAPAPPRIAPPPAAPVSEAPAPTVEPHGDKSILIRGVPREARNEAFADMKVRPIWSEPRQGFIIGKAREGDVRRALGIDAEAAASRAPRPVADPGAKPAPVIESNTNGKFSFVRNLGKTEGKALFKGVSPTPLWSEKREGWVVPARAVEEVRSRLGGEARQPAAPKPRAPRKPKITETDRMENYFRPGRVVEKRYGRDEVLSFTRTGNETSPWNVRVRDADKPTSDVRTHATRPERRALDAWERENPVEDFLAEKESPKAEPVERARRAPSGWGEAEGQNFAERITGADKAALRQRLDDLGLGKVALEFLADLRALNGRVVEGEPDGLYRQDGNAALIVIGNALDPKRTLDHEAIHALRNLGLFTEAEWEVLSRRAQQSWIRKHNVKGRYPVTDAKLIERLGRFKDNQKAWEALWIEEAVAEEFAAQRQRAKDDIREPMTARKAFRKIAAFFDAVRNWLDGMGFQTADDVFGRAGRGEVGRRERGGRAGDAALEQRDRFAAEFLTEIAANDDLFAYPRSNRGTVEGVFKDIDPSIRFFGEDEGRAEEAREAGADRIIALTTAKGEPFWVYETDEEVWIDVHRLKEGSGGSAIYAAIGDYAANTGKVFIGDPAGLSEIALRRRTDALLSSALKHGTTDHLRPHPDQIKGNEAEGVKPLRWREGDTLGNIQSLIEASVSNLAHHVPEMRRARFDFQTGTFRTSQGELISDEMLDGWASQSRRVRAARAGRRTLKRGILLESLLREESGKRPGLLERSLQQSRQLVGGTGRIFYRRPAAPGPFETFEHRTARSVVSMFAPWNWSELAEAENWNDTYHVARRSFADSLDPLKRIQGSIEEARGAAVALAHDAYTAGSLYYGRTGEKLRKFYEGPVREITRALRARKIAPREIDDFLIARHVEERNREIAKRREIEQPDHPFVRAVNDPQNFTALANEDLDYDENGNPIGVKGGSGHSLAWARQVLARVAADPRQRTFDRIAAKVGEINRARLDEAVADGLIAQNVADRMRAAYQHYIPLRGFEGDEDTDGLGAGQGFDTRGSERRATGRSSRADSPLGNVFAMRAAGIVKGEKNRVARSFLRLVQTNPNPAAWSVNRSETTPRIRKTKVVQIDPNTGLPMLVSREVVRNEALPPSPIAENVLVVKVGGENVYITIENVGLARALKNLSADNNNLIVQALGPLTRAMSMLNTTLNPEWFVTNLLRDMTAAGIQISDAEIRRVRREMAKNYLGSFKGALQHLSGKGSGQWKAIAAEFVEQGGKVDYIDLRDVQGFKRLIEGEVNPTRLKRLWESGPKQVFDAIQIATGAAENAIRLAAYKAAVDAGVPKPKAASIARELTVNFNRRGDLGPTMNALYMFFNAAVQGNMRLVQSAMKSGFTRKALAGLVALGALEVLLGAGDEDEYEKVEPYVRERSLVIMLAPFGGKSGDYVKVPLPYGFNVFKTLGTEIGRVVLYGDPERAAANVVGALLNSFNPVGGQDFIAMVTPTMLDPAMDIAINRNFFGSSIRPDYPNDKGPESEKYFPNVSEVSKTLTRWLNDATGGNEFREGYVSISPENVDHVVSSFFGGMGRLAQNVERTAGDFIAGRPFEAERAPFIRQVFGRTFGEMPTWRAYDTLKDRVEALDYEIKEFREARRPDDARAARERNPLLTSMLEHVRFTEKRLDAFRKRERAIYASDRPDAEKDAEIEKLREKAYEAQRRLLGVYDRKKAERAGRRPEPVQ